MVRFGKTKKMNIILHIIVLQHPLFTAFVLGVVLFRTVDSVVLKCPSASLVWLCLLYVESPHLFHSAPVSMGCARNQKVSWL